MKQCYEVMTTNPICCVPSDSLSRAARLMKDDDTGSIPVIENEQSNKLIDIVTDRDVVVQVLAHECDPKFARVSDVMTRQVFARLTNNDLLKAVDPMAKHQLPRLPVSDPDGRIVGIISQADIVMRVTQPEETAWPTREVSGPTV